MNSRLMLPILVPGVLLVLFVIERWAQRLDPGLGRQLALAVPLLLLLPMVFRGVDALRLSHDSGNEYTSGPVRRAVTTEDEDEDDDMLAPDDVEADLDTILKDRMVAADDEDEGEEEEPEERGEAADRLQPKRADEQLCPSCFLLVRQSAPGCPVGDDDCPLFGR